MEKLVTFLGLGKLVPTVVFWIENPCVGGSIPPQATSNSQKACP